MKLNKKKLDQFVEHKNSKKKLLTPGPASLLVENLIGIEPWFGRGDLNYEKIENKVLNILKKISGHKNIVRLQGAASLALEVMILNFLRGNILVIKTGVYSDRIYEMCRFAKKQFKKIEKIENIDKKKINNYKKKTDWVLACYVETSIGLRLQIEELYNLKKRLRSNLALDATASIGLEKNHSYADVIGYSSCKGLFGLTGASFVSYNIKPSNEIKSFNLNIKNHENKKMTGPYHTICSLLNVLKNHREFRKSVMINKKKIMRDMAKNLVFEKKYKTFICTQINKKISSKNKKIIFYKPRIDIKGSIVCHLGEVHLKDKAKGSILDDLLI